jgi:hypothetical protein
MLAIEQLAREDALGRVANELLELHRTGVPVKFCNSIDHRDGKPLLWFMLKDVTLEQVNGKPVIKLAGVQPVPELDGEAR